MSKALKFIGIVFVLNLIENLINIKIGAEKGVTIESLGLSILFAVVIFYIFEKVY